MVPVPARRRNGLLHTGTHAEFQGPMVSFRRSPLSLFCDTPNLPWCASARFPTLRLQLAARVRHAAPPHPIIRPPCRRSLRWSLDVAIRKRERRGNTARSQPSTHRPCVSRAVTGPIPASVKVVWKKKIFFQGTRPRDAGRRANFQGKGQFANLQSFAPFYAGGCAQCTIF